MRLALDAEAVTALVERDHPSRDQVREALTAARRLGRSVVVPAVVLAELSQGRGRTQAVDAVVARVDPEVLDTGRALARVVGSLLHAAGSGSEDLVDAHVVAALVPTGGVALTADPDDLERLATGLPHVTVVRLRGARARRRRAG